MREDIIVSQPFTTGIAIIIFFVIGLFLTHVCLKSTHVEVGR